MERLEETPVETLKRFDRNLKWKQSPIEVLAADFLGLNNESNLFLNPAIYEERNGRLFDPVRKRIVAGSANGNKIEEGIITQLEKWFLSSGSGLAIWISPREPYQEEQLTIYRIGHELLDPRTFETKKVLFLTSHQFKHEFKNPDEIRKFIFTEDDNEESVFEILNWLKNISEKTVQTSLKNVDGRRKKAEHYAELYKTGVPMDELTYYMTQTEFIGSNPFGCPPTTSFSNTTEIFIYGGKDKYGSLEFSCPSCNKTNRRPQNQLISNCQHCGADVRC